MSTSVKSIENNAIQRMKSRNAFFTTKDDWLKTMNESDIILNTDVHSIAEILTQQTLINQVDNGSIELITNMRKGNYGEMTTDEIYRQLGYDRISLDMTTEIDGVTHHGIDGVYYNPDGRPPYIIAEAKYGSSRLSYLKNGTKQMDSTWIGERLIDALGDEKAMILFDALEDGNVGSQLVNIKKNGNIVINNLDYNANIIRPY